MTNCIIFAVKLYLRRAREGRTGYIVIRRSKWGLFPHMLYGRPSKSGDVRVVSYVPVSPRKRLLPPPLFKGRVKWGD